MSLGRCGGVTGRFQRLVLVILLMSWTVELSHIEDIGYGYIAPTTPVIELPQTA
jgi:hypothetical protein